MATAKPKQSTTVSKLLLIRKAVSQSNQIEQAGLSSFVKQDVLYVSPERWHPEAGVSHYGFVLEGLKLEDLAKVQQWASSQVGVTILGLDDGIDSALNSVGLGINNLA